MDDWQEAAFTTRHVHNRVGKSSGGGRGRGSRRGFEVKKTFGSYDVKCQSATKLQDLPAASAKGRKATEPMMDIFRLTDDGRGLLGRLLLPGVLEASLVLTGSRKTLEELVSCLESPEQANSTEAPAEAGNSKSRAEDESNDAHDEEDVEVDHDRGSDADGGSDDEEDKERQRFRNFEKNSFRSPKFWFQWKGVASKAVESERQSETGRGYLVFAGNDCRSFKGTISCESLGWKDVSLSGWKEVNMSERDAAFEWC